MATTVAPPAEQATDLMQKLSLDSQNKSLEIPDPIKMPPTTKYATADSSNPANSQNQPYERSMTPLLQDFMDPATALCYLPSGYPSTAYYYGGGYEGAANEWDDYSRYGNPDGVEGVYGDNGSLMYHHGYGYGPYGPYSPSVPTFGHDGQLYAPQQYQYPTQYFQQPLNPASGPFSPSPTNPSKVDVSTSVPAEQASMSVETANGNSNGISSVVMKANNGSSAVKAVHPNPSFNYNGSYGRGALPAGVPASGYQDPRFAFDGVRSPIPWLDGMLYSDGQHRPLSTTPVTHSISNVNNTSSRNQNIRPHSHVMGLHHPRPMPGIGAAHGYINRMYPNKMYGPYGNAFRSNYSMAPHGYDSRTNGRGWFGVDNKYKPRGRSNGYFGYGNESMDGLNELNRGPRAKGSKNQKGFAPITLAVKGQNGALITPTEEEKEKLNADCEQYNRVDFPETYTDAKFFVIKSYSEDDVHKSIKYNVWASTPNGNKKLDSAYQEALEKPGGCPVFLFFSVNASGQFVGVAEMAGAVDFHKNLDYWQQDKWNGWFPVKWHIVKDVPNNLLKHITLENNENKPVTNSRDTQEVKLEQGLQVIKIFKDYNSKTCILDDFGFYEGRQKSMQEKKAKQLQFTKQIWEGKPCDEKSKEAAPNGEMKSQKTTQEIIVSAPAVQANGDVKPPSENGFVAKVGDAPKGTKPVVLSEKKITSNGVANVC